MKIILPFIIAVTVSLTNSMAQNTVPPPPSQPSNNSTQKIVPPSPSRPFPGTGVYPPDAYVIRFNNGAKVELYRDKFVVMDRDRNSAVIKRPLADKARPPWGCKWLRNQLDTTDCHTRAWRDSLEVYLYRCMNLR